MEGFFFGACTYNLLRPQSKDYFIQLNILSDLIWLGGIVFAYMWKLGLWCCVRCMSSDLKELGCLRRCVHYGEKVVIFRYCSYAWDR